MTGMRRCMAVLLAGVLCACSTAPVVVPAKYTARPNQARAAGRQPAAPCPLVLSSLTDARADRSNLGFIAGREVRGDNFGDWVRSGVEARLKAQKAAAVTPVTLDAELVKAYMNAVAATMSATIVMRVRMQRDGAVLDEKVYRGGSTSVNWGSGTGETMSELGLALGSLLDQVRADANAHCAAPPTT